MGLLVEKGWLKHRAEGKRYIYEPSISRKKSQRNALRRLLDTFFDGSPGDAMAALVDLSATDTPEELSRLAEMIELAQRANNETTKKQSR